MLACEASRCSSTSRWHATLARCSETIARLAREAGVRWFSSSSLRFWDETKRLQICARGSDGYSAPMSTGPRPSEAHHEPDLMLVRHSCGGD